MEDAMKQALRNLNEKLDILLIDIKNIEKKIEKISDKQGEQSRTIGILETEIEHSKDERFELKEDNKKAVDEIWKEIRRKEKMIWGALLAGAGFVGKLIYEWMDKL